MLGRLEQYLKRRKALLAINYFPTWKASSCTWLLFEDHGAKEVACHIRIPYSSLKALKNSYNIFPKRLPLILL